MTDTAGPFDGTPWSEAQWARHAAVWAPSGVYGAPAASTATGDLPLSVSALTVGLGAGRAWVRGFGFERSGAAVMQTVSANTHASFSRRDRIVLRRDLASHTLTPVLLTGTPAGTPAPPGLSQSDTGAWDLPTFSFLVPPNSGTSISGIVDERGWVDNKAPIAFASDAARDANMPTPTKGELCVDAGTLEIYDGTGWQPVRSGAWVDIAVGGSGYSQPASASWVDLPGMSGSVVVPAGRLLDVKFWTPTVNVPPAGGISLRCVVNGGGGRTATFQANSSNPGYAVPGTAEVLSYLGTGASVTFSAQIIGAAGGGYVQGDGFTGPTLSYRIA